MEQAAIRRGANAASFLMNPQLTPHPRAFTYPSRHRALVAELVDALVSGTSVHKTWRFESSPGHQVDYINGPPSGGLLLLPPQALTLPLHRVTSIQPLQGTHRGHSPVPQRSA